MELREYLKTAADTVARQAMNGPVAVDPDVAEFMGSAEDQALSYEDALDSLFDDEPGFDLDEDFNGEEGVGHGEPA